MPQSDSKRGTEGKATEERWMIPPGAPWAHQESPRESGGASCPAPQLPELPHSQGNETRASPTRRDTRALDNICPKQRSAKELEKKK